MSGEVAHARPAELARQSATTASDDAEIVRRLGTGLLPSLVRRVAAWDILTRIDVSPRVTPRLGVGWEHSLASGQAGCPALPRDTIIDGLPHFPRPYIHRTIDGFGL